MEKLKSYVKRLRFLRKLQREQFKIKEEGMIWRDSERYPGTMYWSHTNENDPMFPCVYATPTELLESYALQIKWWQKLLLRYL